MKILITENQLEKVIRNYISNYFKNAKIEYDRGEVRWIVNGKRMMRLYESGEDFGTVPSLTKEIEAIFGLPYFGSRLILKNWAKDEIKKMK